LLSTILSCLIRVTSGDAVADGDVGVLGRRTRSRAGKYRIRQLISRGEQSGGV